MPLRLLFLALLLFALPASAEDAFEAGLSLLRAGDRQAALLTLEPLAAKGDTAAALLAGICRYELGEPEKARPHLLLAAQDPEVSDAAELFLGLLAQDAGESRTAQIHFERAEATRDPALRVAAGDLRRLASRSGRLQTRAELNTGYDSNLTLAPDGAPGRSPPRDGFTALQAEVGGRLSGGTGPYLLGQGNLRRHLFERGFDTAGGEVALGLQLGSERQHLRAEYSLGHEWLGPSPFRLSHGPTVRARMIRSGWLADGSYLLRFDRFAHPAVVGYSGPSHLAQAAVLARPAATLSVGPALRSSWVLTDDPTLGWSEHGAALRVRWVPAARLKVSADLGLALRLRPLPGATAQRHLEAAAAGEWELADAWSLTLSLHGRHAQPSPVDPGWTRVTVLGGIGWQSGHF
jgi:tetratricopeptide (TPR) repeat protein